jgi:uncharacterized protein (DUF1778 family)
MPDQQSRQHENDTIQANMESDQDQTMFRLPPEQFEELRKTLDRPASPNEPLTTLLSRKPGWER